MHPNFDRHIVNIQQIYGIQSKKHKKLDRLSPPKSIKKLGIELDVEGESKPILASKYRKPSGNIFKAAHDVLNDLGIM